MVVMVFCGWSQPHLLLHSLAVLCTALLPSPQPCCHVHSLLLQIPWGTATSCAPLCFLMVATGCPAGCHGILPLFLSLPSSPLFLSSPFNPLSSNPSIF